MSDSTKKVLLMIVAVIVGIWALQFVVGLALALIFKVIVPVLIVAAIGYGLYYAFGGRKSIGSGNRKILP